ncbi:hypothetical protein C8034_v011598 [Colletotrichum sidae]|uniref:Uncharacterized protein n=1 Tax=Colletotrichum sidae TaxID=1347389 RepID=A0A4R8T2H3_9PEZI|nr:hypothetical protein C8034_v011598 [Colletotrichum sidae]
MANDSANDDLYSKVLSLNLFDDDDDEEDAVCKQKLTDLANGTTNPRNAAIDFDRWVVQRANDRLTELLKKNGHGSAPRYASPNVSGTIEVTWAAIARLCSAFPPHHPGQDTIIQFLEVLGDLPKHQAPDQMPESESDETHLVTLWQFGDNDVSPTEIFRREAEEFSYPYSDIETPGSEVAVRWRNFQSAVARITALGISNLAFLSALGDILPSHPLYPDLEERKIGGPNRVSGDTVAAAQWMMWPDEGRFAYQQCKNLRETGPRSMWHPERWQQWKVQFAFVEGDERFTPKARLAAKLARQQMASLEEEDRSH